MKTSIKCKIFTTRIMIILTFSIFLTEMQYAAAQTNSTSPDCPQCVADFALYDPQGEEDGVWEEEVIALKAMFDAYGWAYQTVDASQINQGILGQGTSKKYRSIISPGGYAYYRMKAVNSTGDQNIRNFIKSGGNYVGLCAGSYWVADTVRWAQNPTGGNGTYYMTRDYKNYACALHLLHAVAQGLFGWTPWKNGTGASYQVAAINLKNPTMKKIGMPSATRFLYYGGPILTNFNGLPKNFEVWATAVAPAGPPYAASIGNGKPTVIKYNYGKGKIVLFSYHPTILINSLRDGVVLHDYIEETTMTWDTGNQTQGEINLYSWNIVHAALQTAANEEVTPLTSLP